MTDPRPIQLTPKPIPTQLSPSEWDVDNWRSPNVLRITHEGHLARFGIGYIGPKGITRKVFGGPVVPGPDAYLFGLSFVIDNHGGTGAEIRRNQEAGLEWEASDGDLLRIGGQVWYLRVPKSRHAEPRLKLIAGYDDLVAAEVADRLLRRVQEMLAEVTPATDGSAMMGLLIHASRTMPVALLDAFGHTSGALAAFVLFGWNQADNHIEAARGEVQHRMATVVKDQGVSDAIARVARDRVREILAELGIGGGNPTAERGCGGCDAVAGEECRPMCTGHPSANADLEGVTL